MDLLIHKSPFYHNFTFLFFKFLNNIILHIDYIENEKKQIFDEFIYKKENQMFKIIKLGKITNRKIG